jgi:hypothetical protein
MCSSICLYQRANVAVAVAVADVIDVSVEVNAIDDSGLE